MIRAIILTVLILKTVILISQDTTVTWLTNINVAEFKIAYKKRAIPREFYDVIGIDHLRDIASAHRPYRQGCIANGLPGHRLNWLAKDDKGHWVLSVSFGGRGHNTKYIFIDHDKNKKNINGFYFLGEKCHDLVLSEMVSKIKSHEYNRMDTSYFK